MDSLGYNLNIIIPRIEYTFDANIREIVAKLNS